MHAHVASGHACMALMLPSNGATMVAYSKPLIRAAKKVTQLRVTFHMNQSQCGTHYFALCVYCLSVR